MDIDIKKNNGVDEEDTQMDNALASLYASTKNSNKPFFEAEKKVMNELEKTAVINKPDTNNEAFFDIIQKDNSISSEDREEEDDDIYVQPYQPVFNEYSSEEKQIAKKETLLQFKKKKKQNKRKQFTRTFTHIFGSILLLVFIISVSAFSSYYLVRIALDFTGITVREFEIEVEIPEYATTEEIAEILTKNGIITMPQVFTVYSRISDSEGKYLYGLFNLDSAMSYSTIISSLQRVNKIKETVTIRIREGMTTKDIGLLLEENFICKATDFEYYYKNKQNKYNFEKRVLQSSGKFYQLEGYLFPDTYEFYIVDDLAEGKDIDTSSYAEIVANKIYANFNSKITKEMYKKINEMGFTLDEFMTLASMVQAEAGTIEDMSLVASVFLNRLRNNSVFPKLQSDVTIIYSEKVIRPFVNSRNEGIYNPIMKAYNTYETDGLPPGPICNPGMDAIEAVLNAPYSDYYYFCANVDTLEVYYARSIQEHEANLIIAGLV